MNFKLILLASCLLVLASAHRPHGRHGHHGGHRHRHHHGGRHHGPFVNFEVHEPMGLTVSMVQRSPNTTFFGIELFVNRNPLLSNETHCDVCQNSTSTSYGKFIVQDDQAVIKKGDVLYYYVLLGNSSVLHRLHLQRTWVTDSIINRCNCTTASALPDIDLRYGEGTPSPNTEQPITEFASNTDDLLNELGEDEHFPFECDLDPVTNKCRTGRSDKLVQSNQDLEREVEILEAVIKQMGQTTCGSGSTTNRVHVEGLHLPNSNDQLMDVVKSALSINPEMQELTSRVKHVTRDRRNSYSVDIDMFSYVDKQKVLYHARLNNLNHISDYDVRQFRRPNRKN